MILAAIFVSMELSRSTWLITSLSPGGGDDRRRQQLCLIGVVTITWLWPKESRGLSLSSGCGRRPPILEGFASEEAERAAGDKMALDVEGVVDGGVSGQEPLR